MLFLRLRSFVQAGLMSAAIAVVIAASPVTPAAAAPPVATPSPGYDARLAESRVTDMSASRRRYHHHRYYRYYGAQPLPYEGYRPYPGRPYYYQPCYSCGPFVVPFLGFGFGW
jgi:hypothetical protein